MHAGVSTGVSTGVAAGTCTGIATGMCLGKRNWHAQTSGHACVQRRAYGQTHASRHSGMCSSICSGMCVDIQACVQACACMCIDLRRNLGSRWPFDRAVRRCQPRRCHLAGCVLAQRCISARGLFVNMSARASAHMSTHVPGEACMDMFIHMPGCIHLPRSRLGWDRRRRV